MKLYVAFAVDHPEDCYIFLPISAPIWAQEFLRMRSLGKQTTLQYSLSPEETLLGFQFHKDQKESLMQSFAAEEEFRLSQHLLTSGNHESQEIAKETTA